MVRSGPTRVALVDRHDLFSDCLRAVLETRGFAYHRVPIPAGTDQDDLVRSRLLEVRPDVALVNANLGVARRVGALIGEVSRGGVAVVVLVDVDDEVRWGQYLAAGARAVAPMSGSLASVISAVRRLGRGEPVLDRAERERLIALGRRRNAEVRAAAGRIERLSAQEGAVLRELMAGHAVPEIATAHRVAVATVRTQVKGVLAKLEVSSQLSAVAVAHVVGWTEHPTNAA
jgi:two-component system, NarL family, nitrate/nitrite response regulator NarL